MGGKGNQPYTESQSSHADLTRDVQVQIRHSPVA
jgi:hypothetical protein